MFNVFGEKSYVYLILGAVLYAVAGIFVYFSLKALVGIVPALGGFITVFAFAYISDGSCIYAVQDNIMFVIASFVIMLFMLVLKLRHQGLMISPANAVLFAIMGLLLGIVSSFYPGMLLLLIPVIFILIADAIDFSELDLEYEEPHRFVINRPWLPLLTVILSTALGFLGLTFINGNILGITPEASLRAFADRLQTIALIPDTDRLIGYALKDYLVFTVLLSVAIIFAFLDVLYSGYDRACVYIVSLCPIVFLYLFTDMSASAHILALSLLVAVAVCGLRSLICYEPVPAKSSEDKNAKKKAREEKKALKEKAREEKKASKKKGDTKDQDEGETVVEGESAADPGTDADNSGNEGNSENAYNTENIGNNDKTCNSENIGDGDNTGNTGEIEPETVEILIDDTSEESPEKTESIESSNVPVTSGIVEHSDVTETPECSVQETSGQESSNNAEVSENAATAAIAMASESAETQETVEASESVESTETAETIETTGSVEATAIVESTGSESAETAAVDATESAGPEDKQGEASEAKD